MSQSVGKVAAERNQRILLELAAQPGNGKNPAGLDDDGPQVDSLLFY
jgi:hypothetical protein